MRSPLASTTPRTCPSVDFDVVHAALEADLAAQRLYGFAHFLHHAHQAEGADVRFADVEDFFRRAGLDEFGPAPFGRRCLGSLIWLYSLPSENVPAPPSPNCTLDSGLSTPCRHRPKVSLVRSRTALPRSRMSGRKPICARISPANKPAGPGADHHRALREANSAGLGRQSGSWYQA